MSSVRTRRVANRSSGVACSSVRSIVFFLLTVATVLVSGCSNDSSAGPDTSAKVTTTTRPESEFTKAVGKPEVPISVVDNNYEPKFIEVTAGTKLIFTNQGRNPHTVTPDVPGAFKEVKIDEFQPDDTYELTLDKPGDYGYYCTVHGAPGKAQFGTIRVVPKA